MAGQGAHSGLPCSVVALATFLQSRPSAAHAPFTVKTIRSKSQGSTQAENHTHPKPDSCLLWGKEGSCSPSGRADLPGGGWWTVAGQGRAGKQSSVPMTGRRRTRNHSLRGKTERRVAELVEDLTSRRHGRPQALKQML